MIGEFYLIFLAGMIGAITSDILKDNRLELPKKFDGSLYLGFVGGAIIGGLAGLTIDGSITTAFMGGFTGKAVIESLLNKRQ